MNHDNDSQYNFHTHKLPGVGIQNTDIKQQPKVKQNNVILEYELATKYPLTHLKATSIILEGTNKNESQETITKCV